MAVWAVALRADELPRHIVLLIGDGMGEGHVAAARAWLGRPLRFEEFPFSVMLSTEPAGGGITDSAAASTAMATGRRVANGVISRAIPGDGTDLPTLGERFHSAGRRLGLVTTSYVLDATPAAFASHASYRSDHVSIMNGYLAANGPRLLLGGGYGNWSTSALETAGFTLATTPSEMWMAATSGVPRLAGLFGGGVIPCEYDGLNGFPGLEDMTRAALAYLGRTGEPTFLVIEGGRIDHAAHANDLARCLGEMIAFERAVEAVLAWRGDRTDVLVVVAADHETGGLRVIEDRGPGVLPSVSWSSTWHTAAPIRAYAIGAGADRLLGARHLSDLHGLLADPSFPAPEVLRAMANAAPQVRLHWLAISGRVYRIEASPRLPGGPWQDWGTVTARQSGVTETLLDWTGSPWSAVFFRILQSAGGQEP